MTGPQATLIAAAFLIILLITAVVQLKWLRGGRVQTVLVFLSGVLAVGALWAAGIPPAWFSGSKTGFGLAASLTFSGLVMRGTEERAFGLPLLLAMGLSLFVFNIARVVAGAL